MMELKPCPFCGSTALGKSNDMVSPDMIYMAWVCCQECNTEGPKAYWHDTLTEAEEEARLLWNKRA